MKYTVLMKNWSENINNGMIYNKLKLKSKLVLGCLSSCLRVLSALTGNWGEGTLSRICVSWIRLFSSRKKIPDTVLKKKMWSKYNEACVRCYWNSSCTRFCGAKRESVKVLKWLNCCHRIFSWQVYRSWTCLQNCTSKVMCLPKPLIHLVYFSSSYK